MTASQFHDLLDQDWEDFLASLLDEFEPYQQTIDRDAEIADEHEPAAPLTEALEQRIRELEARERARD